MDAIIREKRIRKSAIVLLLCVATAEVATRGDLKPGNTAGQQGAVQRLPGPGTGIVDVGVVNEVKVTQQGTWRVGVEGTVTAEPLELPFFKVGETYAFQWAEHWTEVGIVREMHRSGWVRVESPDHSRNRWFNPSQATSIERR